MSPRRQTVNRNRKPGFTLVELLVVIAIIGALVALLVVGASAAIRAARETAIKVECTQLDDAFTKYKDGAAGGAYPPNLTGTLDPVSDFRRHFSKAFSKQREPQDLLTTLATGVSTGNATIYTPAGYQETGISPYEAIVFWLGGFSDDVKYPISGPSGPSFIVANGEDLGARKGFDFDETRLGPKAIDNTFDESRGRYVTYTGPNGETRRINLWWYTPPKLTVPYAYFDASKRPKSQVMFDGIAPIVALKTGAGSNYQLGNLRLANEGKCQILAAGLDDAWGDFASEQLLVDWSQPPATNYNGLVYPEGPWTGDLADTITNFSTNRTLEASQP